MNPIEKTESLKRVFISIDKLEINPLNPNEMSDSEFNMLVDNITEMGITDPILVRPHPEEEGMFRIIGGKHRLEVARLLDFKEVPCTVVNDPEFNDDKEKFQIVRHNIIHGRMSPEKFFNLYNSLSKKYTEEIAAEMFGFVERDEFEKLIKSTAKTLPKEMQKEYKEAASQLKTIDQLSALLNSMFEKYGNTLQYGYMIVDFGGKDSVWIRMSQKNKVNLLALAQKCIENKRTLDSVLNGLISSVLLKQENNGVLEEVFSKTEEVEIPDGLEYPTEEKIKHSAQAKYL